MSSEGIVYVKPLSHRLRVLGAIAALFLLSFSATPLRAEIGAHILIDAKTGKVLSEKNATRKWYPASLTKMMTAYVTFKAVREERISLQSAVVQSKNSLSEPPSKMGFKVGTQLTIDNALKIILVKSANDISVAIGEAVAGSEPAFLKMMNDQARALGMKHTKFVNPHGLPDNRQVTTARDMAVLAQALWRDFPEAREYYKHPGIKFGKKTLRSANREYLLRVKGANGMKTGFICNSGYNVAASATRRGRTLIAVVLGAASGLERIAFTRQLMDKGFRKRSGRYNLNTLPHKGGQPPADRYCKRNPKPGVDGIMARFDMQKSRSSALSYSDSSEGSRSILPNLRLGSKKKKTKVDTESVKRANGKVDWGKVLDRTIGPRRIAYAPIRVRTGLPKGVAPRVANIPAKDIPVPTANPRRTAIGAAEAPVTQGAAAQATEPSQETAKTAPGAVAQKQFAKSETQPSSGAPGSLFQKGKGFGVPLPSPKPQN